MSTVNKMTPLTPEAIELAIRSELHLPPVYSADIRRAAKRIYRLISDDSPKPSDDYRMNR